MADKPAKPLRIGERLLSALLSMGIYSVVVEFAYHALGNTTTRSPLLFPWDGYVLVAIFALYGGYKGITGGFISKMAVALPALALPIVLLVWFLSSFLPTSVVSIAERETIGVVQDRLRAHPDEYCNSLLSQKFLTSNSGPGVTKVSTEVAGNSWFVYFTYPNDEGTTIYNGIQTYRGDC